MFFTGTLAASVTLANFQADIIGILTGSITSSAGLSANFIDGNFINTVAPGWELHDAAAGAINTGITPAVIRAPYSDDPTKFKHLYIDYYAATALGFTAYETWDNVAHTGTNPVPTTSVAWKSMVYVANYYVTISASSKHLLIAISSSATSTYTYLMFVSEYSRDDPWNNIANGYPAWLITGSSSTAAGANGGVCRIWNPSTVADVVSQLFTTSSSAVPGISLVPNGLSFRQTPPGANTGGAGIIANAQYFECLNTILGSDPNKAAVKYVYEMAVRLSFGNTSGFPIIPWLGGNLSSINQTVYYGPNLLGGAGDDIIINSDTYRILVWGVVTTGRILVKQV